MHPFLYVTLYRAVEIQENWANPVLYIQVQLAVVDLH